MKPSQSVSEFTRLCFSHLRDKVRTDVNGVPHLCYGATREDLNHIVEHSAELFAESAMSQITSIRMTRDLHRFSTSHGSKVTDGMRIAKHERNIRAYAEAIERMKVYAESVRDYPIHVSFRTA